MPINFVEKHSDKLQKQVVKGDGISATIVATPKHKNPKKSKDLWRVLLDSGSDGDLLFVHRESNKHIPCKERIAPQKWRTSNGTFKTTKVGVFELILPVYLPLSETCLIDYAGLDSFCRGKGLSLPST